MEFPLDTVRRRGILVASIVLAALVIFQAGWFWFADSRMRSGKIGLTQFVPVESSTTYHFHAAGLSMSVQPQPARKASSGFTISRYGFHTESSVEPLQ